MDILGVGGWELVAILLIMLVVAGPKRMISWSYTLGKYVSQLRQMWAETAQMLQKEFDEAGVDVQVPKDIPTRNDLNREIGRALTPISKPFQESMEATRKELDSAKKSMSLGGPTPLVPTNPSVPAVPATPIITPPTTPTPAPITPADEKPVLNGNGNGSSNGNSGGEFGTWSQGKDQQ